jgi:hypothetical protein
MKILFSRSNLTRKANYQIATSIYENKNKKYVRKLALTNKSLSHLQDMNKTYSKLKKNSIPIPKIINKEKNYIDFEYLSYSPIDTIIERLILTREFDKTKRLLKIYLSFISNLKEVKISPYKNKAFVKLFDPRKSYIQDKEEFCLDQSILDYNLDNLLLDENKNKLCLIDWEWTFDFPLPKNYVIFRSIFYLSSRLQSIITTFCSADFPCYEILNNFFVPKIWWNLLTFSQKDVERFLFYENSFQNSVNIIKQEFKKEIILSKIKLISQQVSQNLDSYIQNIISQKSVPTEETKIKFEQIKIEMKKVISRNKKLENQIEEATIENQKLKNQIKEALITLNIIKSAKFFKLWQGYCNIRDKILKKKL